MKKQDESDDSIKNPHNNFFLKVFSNKNIAKGYFKEYLPPIVVKNLDFRTLKLANVSFIDEKLKPHYSDLIFICRWKKSTEIYLPILLEHQSKKPTYPHLKLLQYLMNGYEYQISGLARGSKLLNVIIPMFLYHGKAKWEFQPFHEFFHIPDEQLIQFIPNFVYLLNNLTTTPDEELKSKELGYLVATMLLLKHYHDKHYIIEKVGEIFTYAQEYAEDGTPLDRYILRSLVYITNSVKVDKTEIGQMVENVSKKLKKGIMTAYEEIKMEGKIEGKIEEKELIVKKILAQFPDWSDQKIADFVEVSIDFVKRVKSNMKRSKK